MAKGFSQPISVCIWILTSENHSWLLQQKQPTSKIHSPISPPTSFVQLSCGFNKYTETLKVENTKKDWEKRSNKKYLIAIISRCWLLRLTTKNTICLKYSYIITYRQLKMLNQSVSSNSNICIYNLDRNKNSLI